MSRIKEFYDEEIRQQARDNASILDADYRYDEYLKQITNTNQHSTKMKREELLEIVKAGIVHISDPMDDVREESFLEGDLGMDSLDFVEAEMEIEKRIGVTLPNDLLTESLSDYTVGKVTDEIYQHLKAIGK